MRRYGRIKSLIVLARPKRFELLTPRFVSGALSARLGGAVRYAICQLSRASGAAHRDRWGFAELLERIEDNAVRVMKQK
jgi:hypothetical protein